MRKLLILSMLLFLSIFSCSEQSTNPDSENKSSFDGITETDQNGNIIHVDEDDWHDIDILSLIPAYPNPIVANSTDSIPPVCNISFFLQKQAEVKIVVTDDPEHVLTILAHDRFAAGHYLFSWPLTNNHGELFNNGIYRVYFTLFTEDSVFESFGDVELNGLTNANTVEPLTKNICFMVNWRYVTIENFWDDGTSHMSYIDGVAEYEETIIVNNERHDLHWSNVKYHNSAIESFIVSIDSVNYQYPLNQCK